MSGNRIKIISILILVFVSITLLFKLFNCSKDKDYIVSNIKLSDSGILEKMIFLQIESEDYKINTNTDLVNLSGDSLKLSEIIGENPKLIFYLDENICNSCVEDELKRLSKYNTPEKNDLAIISIKGHRRDLFILDKKYKLNGRMYISNSPLGIPAEKSKQPFLFILQKNTVSNVFIPNKNISNYSVRYLNIINSKFFK